MNSYKVAKIREYASIKVTTTWPTPKNSAYKGGIWKLAALQTND